MTASESTAPSADSRVMELASDGSRLGIESPCVVDGLMNQRTAQKTRDCARQPTICQLLHGLTVGGAEVLAARLAQRLRPNYRFIFVCLDELGTLGKQLQEEGFSVSVIGRNPGVDFRAIWRLA